MKRRTAIAVGIGIATLAAIPLVYAGVNFAGGEGCPFGGGHRGGHGIMKLHALKSELNLTDEQEKALWDVARRTREQNAGTKKALKNGIHEAARVLLADPSNLAGAQAVIEKQEATIEQVRNSVLSGVSEGLQVLTPEQRQKLTALLAEHEQSE